MKKQFLLLLMILFSMVLIGCNEPKKEPPVYELNVEYDELLYYSQIGKIKIISTYEEDYFDIESLNENVIKILKNNGDDMIAKAVGLGEATIVIRNAYDVEKEIKITVEAKEGFAPPIESMELTLLEKGPYYIGETYHLQVKCTPSIYNDSYRFIESTNKENPEYIINHETGEIKFLHTGSFIVSVFSEGKSKRANLTIDVTVSKTIEMYEILFVGNSRTYYHDIPRIICDMIAADGVYVNYVQDTKGYSYLIDHEDNFNKYIDKYQFSHVILQEFSRGPIENYDKFYGAVTKFAEKVKVEKAELILYQTWGYHNYNWQGYSKYEMLEKLVEANDKVAFDTQAKVTRVGEAFKLFEETYGLEPSLYDDENHQSLYGAFLSACVHYSMLTGRRASDSPYVIEGIEYDMSVKIREIADIISFDK